MEAALVYKDFHSSLRDFRNKGSLFKKPYEKVAGVLVALQEHKTNPRDVFRNLKVTDHGENRIKSCIKYELGGPQAPRLVTVQKDKMIILCFAGDHDSVDKWINKNKNFTPIVDKNGEIKALKPSIDVVEDVVTGTDWLSDHQQASVPLLDRLPKNEAKKFVELFPSSAVLEISRVTTNCSPEELIEVSKSIEKKELGLLLKDVFDALLQKDVETAQDLIELHVGEAKEISDVDPEDLIEVVSGDSFKVLRIGSEEYNDYINNFSKYGSLEDWFLFMHPDQDKIMREDLQGPSQLSGISGSGKTCIAIKRAFRLAQEDKNRKILVVTLNPCLAGLIKKLLEHMDPEKECSEVIEVHSLFSLFQKYLGEFEPKRKNYYSEKNDLDEHIDQVFREYYRQKNNNDDAKVLERVHRNLLARGVNAEHYIREEFDWIRSGWFKNKRSDYLHASRKGRRTSLDEQSKKEILSGLELWEEKMESVGIIDYLGLTTALSKYLEQLEPKYTHIIIDEAQDFGTTELAILARLADTNQNLFLCGDISQTVLPKQRNFKEAGIQINNANRRKVLKNYRNTKQILEVAYHVLLENLVDDFVQDDDLELLDPKFANRHSSAPWIYSANSLEEEFAYARQYISEYTKDNNSRCCIAIAGYTHFEMRQFASEVGLRLLEGHDTPINDRLVLSDLEQTKGYEFDLMVILNCCKDILPPADVDQDERYRYGCQLYVAMTRAKDELILSFNGEKSDWLDVEERLVQHAQWKDWFPDGYNYDNFVKPEKIPEFSPDDAEFIAADPKEYSGKDFMFTKSAIGLSREAQAKFIELVDGRGAIRDGERVKWKSINDALKDIEKSPRVRGLFSRSVVGEIRNNRTLTFDD